VRAAAGLRAALADSLADFMLPGAFVVLEQLPLTPNGKVDLRALPAPDQDAAATRAYVAPEGETETALARAWQQLLGLDRVGRHDHFFELGGHSLMVISLIERLRQGGMNADVKTAFGAPVLCEMAAAIEQGAQAKVFAAPPNLIEPDCAAITPAMLPLVTLSQDEIDRIVAGTAGGVNNVQDIYRLAPLQEGILFHHLIGGEGDAYLLRAVVGFDSRSRLDGFLQALRIVIARHDILRTSIRWTGLPHAVQVVQRSAQLPVIELELEAGRDALEQLNALVDPATCASTCKAHRCWPLTSHPIRHPDAGCCRC
jgi:hypothetical protein